MKRPVQVRFRGPHYQWRCHIDGCLTPFAQLGSEATREEAVEGARRHLRIHHPDVSGDPEVVA